MAGLLLLAVAMLSACATAPPVNDATVFVVVRHAEKVIDGSRDPPLDSAGQVRALSLATRLRGRDVVAVYATDYRRTRQTARPVAQAHGIEVITYDAAVPAAAFVAQLLQDQAGGTVLIVGHSNTVPDIVSALCRCEVAPIDESDYGNLYEVSIQDNAEPVLVKRRY